MIVCPDRGWFIQLHPVGFQLLDPWQAEVAPTSSCWQGEVATFGGPFFLVDFGKWSNLIVLSWCSFFGRHVLSFLTRDLNSEMNKGSNLGGHVKGRLHMQEWRLEVVNDGFARTVLVSLGWVLLRGFSCVSVAGLDVLKVWEVCFAMATPCTDQL